MTEEYRKNISAPLAEIFSSGRYDRALMLTDGNVERYVLPELLAGNPELRDVPRLVVEPGEGSKTLQTAERIWRRMVEEGMTRRSLLINVGGGMVTDLGGFAAACFKRGIAFVNIPTSLLAMVDAATGGKTGVDFLGLKNEIGAFAQPLATLIYPGFLRTLPKMEFLSGYGEMLKTGLIADADLYSSLLDLGKYSANPDLLGDAIRRCVEIKEDITGQDPEEKGLRKILNFGHTAGHAFESFAMETGRGIPHGVAVAYGILMEMVLSVMLAGLPSETLYPYSRMLKENYPLPQMKCGDFDRLYALMLHDKKNSTQGKINFTLLPAIGKATTDYYPTQKEIEAAYGILFDQLGL